MPLLVDRLWPVNFEYKGNKLTIDFVWAVDSDIPQAVQINLSGDQPGQYARLGDIKKNWDSYEEAVAYGEKTAKAWVDKLEVDQLFSR